MGIDLGFDDADAIAVLAWHEDRPETYLVDEIVVPQQGITELVKQIDDPSGEKVVVKNSILHIVTNAKLTLAFF